MNYTNVKSDLTDDDTKFPWTVHNSHVPVNEWNHSNKTLHSPADRWNVINFEPGKIRLFTDHKTQESGT
jgi:hypothetical protein